MTTSDSIEKETTFTPGPWRVTRKFEVGPVSHAFDQTEGMVVPIADVFGDNRDADARLMAAAPELYEALAEIELQWLPYSDADLERFARMHPDDGGAVQPHWAEKILASRRALRKARGEDRSHEGK